MPAPTKKEIELTPKQIRDLQAGTFSRPPWNHLNKNRVGVDKLTEALSEGLAGMIMEKYFFVLTLCAKLSRLPALKEELSLKKKKIQENLDGLPESFEDNPQTKFLHLCKQFNAEIHGHATAKLDNTEFFQALQEGFSALENRILATRPNFQAVPEKAPNPPSVASERGNTARQGKLSDCANLS